jgi:hypothetical protein
MGRHLIPFLLVLLNDIDIGLIHFLLKSLGRTLSQTLLMYSSLACESADLALVVDEARNLVDHIRLTIVEFGAETLYSTLFAQLVRRLPHYEFTLTDLEVVGGFIRNETRDQIESFAAAIIEFGLQLRRFPSMSSQSCSFPFSVADAQKGLLLVVGTIGFKELMEAFSRREFRTFGNSIHGI